MYIGVLIIVCDIFASACLAVYVYRITVNTRIICLSHDNIGSVTSARPTTARATTARGQLLAVTIARKDNCARCVLLGRQLLAVNSAVNSALIVSATY